MKVPVIIRDPTVKQRTTDQTRTVVFEMLCCIVGSAVPGIWKEHIAFILHNQVNQFSTVHSALSNEGT
jgi:hypothetical protein